MVITMREVTSSSSLGFFNLSSYSLTTKPSQRVRVSTPIASLSVNKKLAAGLCSHSCVDFDSLGINSPNSERLSSIWDGFLGLFSLSLESSSSTKRDKPSSGRGVAAAIEDTY